ncbi:PHD-finger family protein [Histomonas meleagridis]|uniref:PHD-finger family protein n=1 Tax=Histomonas meleagridis TaxID=135588 RepID=UPI0035599C5C|nr:PHD-finger family protein [Histomonas meleagridis]KAH0796547.1 PHD-finger family protein [Histomonas meleagridis]
MSIPKDPEVPESYKTLAQHYGDGFHTTSMLKQQNFIIPPLFQPQIHNTSSLNVGIQTIIPSNPNIEYQTKPTSIQVNISNEIPVKIISNSKTVTDTFDTDSQVMLTNVHSGNQIQRSVKFHEKLPLPAIPNVPNESHVQRPANPIPFNSNQRAISIQSIPRSVSVFSIIQQPKDPAPEYPEPKKSSNGLPRTRVPNLEFKPPEPVYFDDESGKYGVRCVCGQAHCDGLLVQCDKCNFWLHGICVCVAREHRDEPFYCPYCTRRIIRCVCENNNKYDVPIVQCAYCKYWVHKSCENLSFGHIPISFLCHKCGGNEFTFPHIRPNFKGTNKTSFVECNRFELIRSIPEGKFRNFIISDLNRSELQLHETIDRYFNVFAYHLFQRTHEFWKVFVESLSSLLDCEQNEILSLIDEFAVTFLYNANVKKTSKGSLQKIDKPLISESITSYVLSLQLPKVEDINEKHIYNNNITNSVCVTENIDEDEFICDIPGYIMHIDEVYSDDGIPLTSIRIYNTDLIVDVEGFEFSEYAQNIQRSFNFNCITKLYADIDGNPRVGIFGVKNKGLILEKRNSLHAINANCKLMLPLDGNIPYPIPIIEWKTQKVKQKQKSVTKNKAQKKNAEISKTEIDFNMSLLSAFCNDIIPPLPIDLVKEKELARNHMSSIVRNRSARSAKRHDEK